MTKIALLGAGGKMGVRLATNLRDSSFSVDHVEVSEEGRRRLRDAVGVECVGLERALAAADAVVLITDHDSFDYDMVAAEARYALDTRHRLTGPTVEVL